MLTHDQYQRARTFLATEARSLERAMAAALLDGAPADEALACLAAFVNPDGGFGHAMEPDLRTPASSVICTTVGLQHLRTLGIGAGHPLVAGALRYLKASYDPALRIWPMVPPAVEDAPHAPWWGYSDDLAPCVNGLMDNPRPEIVGYLWQYGDVLNLRAGLLDETIAGLEGRASLDMHATWCYVRLAETPGLPDDARARLLALLRPLIDAAVTKDPAQWGAYCLRPLDVVSGPDSPFLDLMPEAVHANLACLAAQQGEDGAWAPTFSWGGAHPDAWARAEREWAGILTLDALVKLRRFGQVG